MERIFFSRLIGTLLCLLLVQITVAQGSYYVFKISGGPFFNSEKVVERGSYFQERDTLKLGNNDYVMLVNQKGELFELVTPNIYTLLDVPNFKLKMEYSSFSKKYFSYIWQQFTNKRKSKQEAGVVYREERNVQRLIPIDSSKVYRSQVWFSWKNNTDKKLMYFFLKDLKTGHMTKIGTFSDSLLLQIDNYLLKPGNLYEWSVAISSFPNLNELEFSTLSVLTKEEYLKIAEEVAILVESFKLLGFTEAEIQQAICESYKFCTFSK